MAVRKSDCEGEDFYGIDSALVDSQRPEMYDLGLMNCFCKQLYTDYGKAGLKILFYDNQ